MQGAISGEVGIWLGKPHLDSREEKTAFASRERTGPRWVCGFSLFMKATSEWVHEPEASKLLAIKTSTLRNMRRERRLDAGTHWVYTTGSVGGPVVYNIPEIREMQRQRTIEAVQIKDARHKTEQKLRQQAIEIYDEATDQNHSGRA